MAEYLEVCHLSPDVTLSSHAHCRPTGEPLCRLSRPSTPSADVCPGPRGLQWSPAWARCPGLTRTARPASGQPGWPAARRALPWARVTALSTGAPSRHQVQLSGVMTSIMCVLPGSVHGAESVHGSGGAKSQYGGSVQGSQHSQGQGYTRQLSYHGSREQLSGHHHHGDLGSGHHHDPGEYRQPQHRHRQPETIYDEERDRG